ncbi:MAG TPA: tRNA 2-thiouridine(34) synthase MnmA [Ktedonobacterales bacterium]|jgi:tRNA-specific 2-thiouridylase|nr:tRNA 2-thiouridine(34) synthase MnmA [Ktedonobacterales bacterium]
MTRVVVGMSGGVDSSVAAALLREQGYDVVGIMLRLWSEPAPDKTDEDAETAAENTCCSLESMADARRVAAHLGIPFYVVNVEQPFQQTIVDYFYDEYLAGRTPNPCLRCNRYIRFTLLLERALALGADYLATGHYVRVDDDPATGLRRLRTGLSAEKDQSYVLHVLTQQQLRHALFPLGAYTKPEVRAMAAARGLPVATKAESQEICFVANNDYRGFMRRYAQSTGRTAPAPGPIVDEAGQTLGRHSGLAHYTIGQRKGLGVSAREPLHVLRLDPARNAVVVGAAAALDRDAFSVRQTTFTSGDTPSLPFTCAVKVRYKAVPVPATVTPLDGGRAVVRLGRPQRAITPGQAAVFYGGADGDLVLGGGLIED